MDRTSTTSTTLSTRRTGETSSRIREFSPSLFYEHYETSGRFAEEGDRIGAALALRYHLTNSITLGLDYRFIWKDSNLPDADYYQNLAFLSLYYKF